MAKECLKIQGVPAGVSLSFYQPGTTDFLTVYTSADVAIDQAVTPIVFDAGLEASAYFHDQADVVIGGLGTIADDAYNGGVAIVFPRQTGVDLSTLVAETLTSLAALVESSGAITTPADADKLPLRDSVSGLLAHVSWGNIKAALKAYFDTLYATAATITSALGNWKTILGQRDKLQIITAPDATTTAELDYSLGNAGYIDASAMTGAKVLTITMANWPGATTDFSAYSLTVKCGAAIPSITAPAGWVVAALFSAIATSKTSEFTIRSVGAAAPRMSLVEAY